MNYFENYETEFGNGPYGEYLLIKDKKTNEILGSVYYAINPENNGTSIFYIGYGDKLHPVNDAEKIEQLKLKDPRLGVELFKWVRKNLPQPYYAAFANQDLKRALRAEPTGMEGFDITTGEPITIDIIRRSKKGKKMSNNDKENPLDRVKKELKAKNYEAYNEAMSDLWESVSPGMGQQYKDKYQKSPDKKELKNWVKKEKEKIDPTGVKEKSIELKEKRKEMLENKKRISNSINLTPPEGVRAAARRGIKYHAEGKAGDGFESATLTRAHKIAEGKELTPEHVKRMHSFFERHAGGRSEKASKGEITPWDVAWLAWGGNAGRSWAASKVKELENAKTSASNSNYANIIQKIRNAVEIKDFKEAEMLLNDFKSNLGGLNNINAKEINGVLETIRNLKKYIQENKESKTKNKCNCWEGYKRVPGTEPCAPGSCKKCDSHRKKKKK